MSRNNSFTIMTKKILFVVFLWKNWLIFRHNLIVITLLFVGCISLLLLYLKSTDKLLESPQYVWEGKSIDILRYEFPSNDHDVLYYTPITPEIEDFMEHIRVALQKTQENLKPLGNATDMQHHLEHNCKTNCFGVQFYDFPQDESTANSLAYGLSSSTIRASPKKRFVNDEDISHTIEDDEYVRSGFFTLQYLIDRQYLEKKSTGQNAKNYELEILSLPAIAVDARDGQRVVMFGSLYSMLFNVLLLSTFLVALVEEKQDGIKEFLVIATPLHYLNGVAFFLVRFILYSVFLVPVLISAHFYYGFGNVPIAYCIVLVILYMLSAMCYAYLISVCFHTVFYAKVGGLVLFIIPYIFYLVRGGLSYLATYCLSTKTFIEGLEILQVFSNKHRVFTFDDMFTCITDGSYSMFSICAILIVQCLVYSLLYNYLTCVFPGPDGIGRDFTFFLKPSFYKKKEHRNEYTTGDRGVDAIIIQNLVKSFRTKNKNIVIADHLDMTIKNKQITVLLGHNGVGKTTTLRMIMGSEQKDSGSITVCSEHDVFSYRHLIGFCPQHSAFMYYMTCRQHLEFFAQLRGLSATEAAKRADELLVDLKLDNKADEFGKNLSGGMKRRLSLGIALSGDTKVIVLDEPSSGLDIESRRELWDILLRLRKKKAILITTHHMEEAEVLGDTISILGNGQLICTGSPLELKRKVDSGYILKLIIDNDHFKNEDVLRSIHSHVPEAKIMHSVKPSILISLPYASMSQYVSLLISLENNQSNLGINAISITDTSLEDVFLNCVGAVNPDQVDGASSNQCNNIIKIPYQRLEAPLVADWKHKLYAIFYKKILFLQSDWIYTFVMLGLPFASVALSVLLMSSTTMVDTDHLPLSLNHIKNGTIYIYKTEDSDSKRLTQVLTDEIKKYPQIRVQGLQIDTGSNVTAELLKLEKQNLADFLQNAIGAFVISGYGESPYLKLYYSGNIYHSSVILLNLINNAILKLEGGSTSGINTTYVPIRRFIADISPTHLEYFAVIVPIGMFFYMFFYVVLPFKENVTSFKDLQALPSSSYWCMVFSFDASLHLCVCILLGIWQAVLIRIFKETDSYSSWDQLLIVCSIFFYGCSYMPILYTLATIFRSISTISTYLLLMLVSSAITSLITSSNIQAMMHHESTIMLLSFLPDFNLNHQLRIINENVIINRKKMATCETLNYTSFFLHGFFIFVIVMVIFTLVVDNKRNRQSLSKLFSTCGPANAKPAKIENHDERDLMQEASNEQSQDALIVRNLSKSYNGKAVVCALNFEVKEKECFGLLGVNGAGKTTTFQMMTANVPPTDGTILINGIDMQKDYNIYRQNYGYCPQHDCFNDYMTAHEILKYIGLLRGIPWEKLQSEVLYWLISLDLEKYQDIQIRFYSGGTKRKLNTAIAMICSPSLVFLDEPTTGVDPESRRFLWKSIKEYLDRNKTIVLTSHSMDECEYLCNRLAIMVNGKFRCKDSVPKLKQQLGSGFTVKIKLKTEDEGTRDVVCGQMNERFTNCNCELREDHAGMLTYFIKNRGNIAWSAVFQQMQELAYNNDELIVDYSINESTLEDIFLKLDKNTYETA